MEVVASDAILTTTPGTSIIPDTMVPGNVMTQIETIVEDASGYYISYSTTEDTVDNSVTSSYIQVGYQTCSFSGAMGGCSDSGYVVELPTSGGPAVTSFQSDSFSGSLVGTTMTLPFKAVATSSVSESGNSTASARSGNNGLSIVKCAGMIRLEVYVVLTSMVTLVSELYI
ncbi:hypothetical protein BDP27DRAFT_1337852 [Rhodocollybia butyracea]|uniref:Uncharacterized protein n=1 Tax=Rhodocollybia butyracea TaxID=206335 RepID=A0A9P5P9U7_9AGAR|nr:hypothetical protein BDP27DRAFT_1337852 [Rhodocollybia butyracea]